MNDKLKRILKRSILPLILALLYIVFALWGAYNADKAGNNGLFDFDYATCLLLTLILTGPAYLMFSSLICWVVEFVKFKEYRYEKRSIIISSIVCVTLFLIGAFTFIFLTLGIF